MANDKLKKVYDIIYSVFYGDKNYSVVLSEERTTEKKDDALVLFLSRGVIERKNTLETIIKSKLIKGLRIRPNTRCVLYIGAYLILYANSYRFYAAVSESVELSKEVTKDYKTVNFVLREIVRDLENKGYDKDSIRNVSVDVLYPEIKKAILEKNNKGQDRNLELLSFIYSVPYELCYLLKDNFGIKTTELVLKSFLEKKPVSLVYNSKITNKEELVAKLDNAHINYSFSCYTDEVILAEGFDLFEDFEPFKNGMLTVQDFSSYLTSKIAHVSGDEKVLDVCAAPGGKTVGIAKALKAEKKNGFVISRDISSAKVNLINENIARCGLDNVKTEVFDATLLDEKSIEKFDLVLLDVPCSGIGIIGKKPDIKYNINEQFLDDLVSLQKRIIHNAVQYVKKGGVLIYSTCTLN
ncbi:MAG: methyltransferase domain-containing protein, partial [Lachnospiraceae bacterium]|nr:methyltransferase domain-containing protein [Lachnospiraceae bacterium]